MHEDRLADRTLDTMRSLVNDEVVDAEAALDLVASYLSDSQRLQAICDRIDGDRSAGQLLRYVFETGVSEGGTQSPTISPLPDASLTAEDVAGILKAAGYEGAWDGNVQVCYVEEIPPDAPIFAADILGSLLNSGVTQSEVIALAERFLTADVDLLEIYCEYIDASGKAEDFYSKSDLSRYCNSPSLRMMCRLGRRANVHPRIGRGFAVSFFKSLDEHAAMRVFCDELDKEDMAGTVRALCCECMREGVPEVIDRYLQERDWQNDIMRESHRRQLEALLSASGSRAERRRSKRTTRRPAQPKRLPKQLLAMVLDDVTGRRYRVSSLRRQNGVVSKRTSLPGGGKNATLEGLSSMQCLTATIEAGALSSGAARGFASMLLERGGKERVLALLCRAVDEAGLEEAFARTFGEVLDLLRQ